MEAADPLRPPLFFMRTVIPYQRMQRAVNLDMGRLDKAGTGRVTTGGRPADAAIITA
jgi:hypothetical protein